MPDWRKRSILAHLPRLHAQRRLAGDLSGYDHRSIYDLVLAATEDKESARRAKMQWYERELTEKALNRSAE